ncbi:unnamed protein product [Cuscuta campestris]|uniref:TPX2 C-terminal domain-containing protein n=1 Tax=Cuscuta campestris TaxID=132261 RepID=A0A484ND60_9ASTE|nr:unnamed protein product [Cuscuta campestris]
MDVDDNKLAVENGMGSEAELHQLPSDEEDVIGEKSDGIPNGHSTVEDLESHLKCKVNLNGDEALDSYIQDVKEISTVPLESNNASGSKESEVSCSGEPKSGKVEKALGKPKNGKPLSLTGTKKGQFGKDGSSSPVILNGSNTLGACAKQSSVRKAKSFDERKTGESNSKPGSPLVKTNHAKQSGHPDITSPSDEQLEGVKEKPSLKSLKKGPPIPLSKAEVAQSALSPTTRDAKSCKAGALPNYGFSFKCNERAEKRKEFYSKLEEKIHAKEVEKTTLQEKTKQSQEAEIKMLRKKLAFKATPMPNFYQEPSPPKVELKKVPPTRAKSPKLGRKKSSPTRLSLDERVPQDEPTKRHSLVGVKTPQRKSLPKLPSEKTNLSGEIKKAPAHKALPKERTETASPSNNAANVISEVAPKEETQEPATADVGKPEELIETNDAKIETNDTKIEVNNKVVVEAQAQ